MKKIGIVCAMLTEAEELYAWLGKPISTTVYGDFRIDEYKYEDCEIAFVKSGVGEILAAAATELLITVFKAEIIINYGLCGLLTEGKIGDTFVITSVVHYDFDTYALDNIEVGRYERFPTPFVPTDEKLAALALKAEPALKKGVCASGDKFIGDEKKKSWLKDSFSANVCEMEAAAVVLVATAHNTPTLIIKIVSDTTDNADEFNAFFEKSKLGIVSLLKKLLIKI